MYFNIINLYLLTRNNIVIGLKRKSKMRTTQFIFVLTFLIYLHKLIIRKVRDVIKLEFTLKW
jgi:hypothetical protein